jgi:hypothetical protein
METFRAQELLLQRATEGLDERETAEIASLGADDDMSFDLAAAAVDLATLTIEEMPADVADRVLIAAGVDASPTTVMPAMTPQTLAGFMPPRPISTIPPPSAAEPPALAPPPPVAMAPHPAADPLSAAVTPEAVAKARRNAIGRDGKPVTMLEAHAPPDPAGPVIGHVVFAPPRAPTPAPVIPIESRKRSRATTYAVIAAAASIALAAGAVVWATQRPPTEKIVEVPAPAAKTPTAAEARAELLATSKDVTTLPWTATHDPNATGASGDVVWSATAQRGFMRFKGLAVNDLKAIQYQLWIFDKDRDQEFPVDGGVFDVASTGEIIVPITAKLHVDQPVLFAVTVEKTGGVVVSKRERIVVTATPKA